MMNFQQFVGSITSESVRKQAYRKRTQEGQEWDIVTSERQNSDEHMTDGGQTCRSDVTTESQENPTEVQENDKEVTSVPRPIFVRKEKVEGDDVEPVIF